MKEVLDSNTKISKEAKECVQECVGEFIAFITSEASFQCKNQKRKTVNGDDILWALGQVGFDDYKVILHEYLIKYKAVSFFFSPKN
jgi:nuclear transcription Y subunit beta